MTNQDETYLILFSVGGVQFAAEAFSIQRIAEADWAPETPPEKDQDDDQDDDQHDHIINMARLLNLPGNKIGRTIVIDTPRGARGFVVDFISKEEISPQSITPIPPLLREWMRPVALSGFYVHDEEVVGVLDFQRLAEVVFTRSHPQEPKRTDSKS